MEIPMTIGTREPVAPPRWRCRPAAPRWPPNRRPQCERRRDHEVAVVVLRAHVFMPRFDPARPRLDAAGKAS
jgi:hypothetical protein